MAQRRKISRANYWAPVIARERSIVSAIVWYIEVELLRTRQLPQYMTFTGIHRVPCLRADIQKQAARVYTDIFRTNDSVNKFYAADTGHNHLDGKVGVITLYDTVKCCYSARMGATYHASDSDIMEIPLSPENMEPYKRVYTPTHMPCPSLETCTIRLGNHFSDPNSVSPSVTFHSDIFTEIGGITVSPHTGGQAQQDRLVELIKAKELKLHMEAEKYNHSRQSYKEACRSYMLPTLPFISALERKYVRHMDYKMLSITNNRSTLDRCRSYRYGKRKLNIL